MFKHCLKFGVALIVVGTLFSCSKDAGPMEFPAPEVSVTVVEQKDLPVYIESFGHLIPYHTATIAPQVTGRVLEYKFTAGDEVKEGDVLVVIDPALYKAALDQADAECKEKKASLQLAKDTVERYSELASEDYIAQLDYKQYQTKVETAAAELAAAEAALETAKLNLDYCYVQAPFSGKTGLWLSDVGDTVEANQTPLVTLNDSTPMYALFAVPEKYLKEIREHNAKKALEVVITLHNDKSTDKYTGKLWFIDNTIDPETGAIMLKGIFDNKDKALWSGQFVDVSLRVYLDKDVVIIPHQAVQKSYKGDYVYVIKDDMTAEQRYITLGERTGNDQSVDKGLKKGEKIVIKGMAGTVAGSKVDIKKDKAPETKKNKTVK